jgi:hypothetical protein
MAQLGQESWPRLCKELQRVCPELKVLQHDKIAAYEFTLAAIAANMRALPNLLDSNQGQRIRSHEVDPIGWTAKWG